MRWNPFSLISSAIDLTKKRLFPFEFWEWFKLMIISFLGSSSKGGNFNMSNGRSAGDFPEKEEFLNILREGLKKYWVIGTMIFSFVFILATLFSYVKSVFSFILIESLINKKAKFTFSKNHSKGVSLFLFKFAISIITLLLIGLLAFPYIYSFVSGNLVIDSVGLAYVIFSIAALVVYLIILWVLFLFLYDFAVPYMYVKKTPAWFSLKKIWREIKKNKFETFVYWVARLVVGIVIGLIVLVLIVLCLIIFGLISLILVLIGFLLYKIGIGIFAIIILAIIFGIILFLAFLITLFIVCLPLGVFGKYFGLLNFEKLTKIKILKKNKNTT